MNKLLQMLREEQKVELENLNINELRALGKNICLSSPTVLDKDELVENVLCAMYGPVDVQDKSTTNQKNYEEIDVSNTNDSDDDFFGEVDTKGFTNVKLSTSYESFDFMARGKACATINNGYYVEDSLGRGAIYYNGESKFIDMPREQAAAYGLSNFDNLKFKSFLSPVQNCEYLVDIIEINGILRSKFVRGEDLSLLIAKQPTQNHSFGTKSKIVKQILSLTQVPCGGRLLIKGDNNASRRKVVFDLVNAFSEMQESRVFPILIDYPIEASAIISTIQHNTAFTQPRASLSKNIQNVMCSFNRAIKYVEAGKDAVVIIDSLNALFYLLEECYKTDSYNSAMNTILKLYNMGGYFNNGGSLTICACVDDGDKKLLDRIKSSSMIYIPINKELVKNKVFPAIKSDEIEVVLSNNYSDETAVGVVSEIVDAAVSVDLNKRTEILDYADSEDKEIEELLKKLDDIG